MAKSRPILARALAAVTAAVIAFAPLQAYAFSRVKDLVDVEGVRDNMLVGYGLVVGLNGTGDSLRNAPFTQLSIQTMLERMGVNTRGAQMQTKNTAAVMVTASLPAFSAQGSHMDVSVSALGDAKSLQGGTLLVTPLSARTAISMRWARARSPSAASPRKARAPASRAACRRRAASPTARSSNAKPDSSLPAKPRCACRCAIPI
jgi:flagellar P-ring protein precursor FlgI